MVVEHRALCANRVVQTARVSRYGFPTFTVALGSAPTRAYLSFTAATCDARMGSASLYSVTYFV